MRFRRGLAAVLGSAMAAAVILVPQVAVASSGQSITEKAATSVDALATQLAGPGVTISQASYSGDDRAIGGFAGMKPAVGLDAGVVLSTGKVSELPGPYGPKLSTNLGGGSDPDLATLVSKSTRLYDSAALEFDFVPRADTISIDYVFGSAEYNGFVNKGFNDVFGFFINGKNCAVVNDKPVTINSINSAMNSELFVDNLNGVRDTSLSGLTTVLTCTAAVKPGEVNHAKLAIADAGDGGMDSAVFIGAHGFFSNNAPTASDIAFSLTQNTSVKIDFPGHDLDGDPLSYEIVDQPKNGSLASTGVGAVYTPATDFIGQDSFTYTVSDGIVVSDPYTVSITVDQPAVPAPPVREVRYTALSDTDTTIVLVPLTDETSQKSKAVRVLGDVQVPVSYAIVATPKNGVLSGDGAVRTYRSSPGFIGIDSFQYTSATSGVTSGPATVTLDVVARPVPPVQSRTIPVFPPAPIRVDGGTRELASTGSDIGSTAALAVLALIAGLAVTSVVVLRRRVSS